jgi:hypothetical protein
MFGMKKIILLIGVLFLITNIAYAQDFSVDLDIKQEYLAGQTGYVIGKINNPLPEDWFVISLIGPERWVFAETSLLRVPSRGSNEFRIVIQPPKDVVPPSYPYQYFLKITRVTTNSELEKGLLINVVQTTSAILKDVSLSCESCLDGVSVSGTVYNVGSKTLDLSLVIKIGDKQKTVYIGRLHPFESKPFEIEFSLENMEPKTYDVLINLIDVTGKVFYKEVKSFEIPTIENVIYDKDISTTPFGSIITLKAINKGNTISNIEFKTEPQKWYSFISGPTPSGMVLGRYFWRTVLKPNESVSITYSEIYWPTYVIIIAAVLAVLIFYWQSLSIDFTKTVIGRRTIRADKEISISLHVKNKKGEIKRVTIRDVVPPNFSVISKFETVKPVIRKVANGIELIWKVGNLRPYEERVLHYTIKPIIDLPTKIRLPSAVLKALRRKNWISKYSNRVVLHPEVEKQVVRVKVSSK